MHQSNHIESYAPNSLIDRRQAIVSFAAILGLENVRPNMGLFDLHRRTKRIDKHDLYLLAMQAVLFERRASISFIQRRLLIGYTAAKEIYQRLEKEGVLNAPITFDEGEKVVFHPDW